MNRMPSAARMRLLVLLADDSEPFRRRVRDHLNKTPDFKPVGEAVNGVECIRLARQLRPDVVVMDVLMPDLNGIEATRQIKSEFPSIEVIALSMHGDEGFRHAMLEAGASTYLLKDNVLHKLPRVLHSIAAARVTPVLDNAAES
ncbi:MAG: response regulator [Woeseiaceae bacterium]|nr:response regulator [Woeseiaceae bacterium]